MLIFGINFLTAFCSIVLSLNLMANSLSFKQKSSQNSFVPISHFSLNHTLDQKKLLAEADYAGWAQYKNSLIGEYSKEWLVALDRKTMQAKWWLANHKGLTVPPYIEGPYVYFAFGDGKFSKVNIKTGVQIWVTHLDSFVDRPIVYKNSHLFLQTAAQNLYRIDDQGHVKWVFDIGSARNTIVRSMVAPLISENKIFVSDSQGSIICLNNNTGREFWRYNPDNITPSFNQVMGEMRLFDNLLIISRYDGWFGAIDISDSLRIKTEWNLEKLTASISFSTYSNGLYYLSASDGYLYAVDIHKKIIRWKSLLSSPASFISSGEKRIFISTTDGSIMMISSQTGEILSNYNLREKILVSPVKFKEKNQDYLLYPSASKTFYLFKV